MINLIIDVVVEGLPSLRTSLSQDFLIMHFHPHRGRGKILIQLVDEDHGTRIDVFTPGSSSLTTRLTDSAIGDLQCRIVSAEDLLAKLLSVIYPTTTGASVCVSIQDIRDHGLCIITLTLAAVADRGTMLGDYRVAQLAAACREWTKGDVPADYAIPVRSDVQALLVSGDLDPNTNER